MVTLSSNNRLTIWDYKLGKIKESIQLEAKQIPKGIIFNNDYTLDLCYDGYNIQCIDTNGAILGEYNRTGQYLTLEGNIEESFYDNLDQYIGWKIDTTYKLPSNIYRLSLYNNDKEFHTYIRYDAKRGEPSRTTRELEISV